MSITRMHACMHVYPVAIGYAVLRTFGASDVLVIRERVSPHIGGTASWSFVFQITTMGNENTHVFVLKYNNSIIAARVRTSTAAWIGAVSYLCNPYE